jgi:predicted pyridoxine 5'-phosphate oxidase superfamily flavin-nucleotide-binding protein
MTRASNVFHDGEVAVQERAGVRDAAERLGAGIESRIIAGARSFVAEQEMLVLAAGDPGGEVWASVWFGRRGFAESRDDGRTLWIDRPPTALDVDPIGTLVRPGAALGILAIELASRRRLRINGVVRAADDTAVALDVRESFPNCPKYIAKRHLAPRHPAPVAEPIAHGTGLDEPRLATIERTDTVFVASLHPERGADASHRGGNPGFVRVVDDHTLRVPDYRGNNMFQTLGNLHASGRAGLVFVDFVGRRLLHVTGKTVLRFDTSETNVVTGGTGRSWDLDVTRWIEGALPARVQAELLERWRFNPPV